MVSPTLYFYPRSPCGERPSFAGLCKTHFPFLSTLSLRRATVPNRNISTSYNDFYPRSPCGERQPRQTRHCKKLRFLSTLSLRRATVHYDNYNLHCVEISIHALLAESDNGSKRQTYHRYEFLSTLSLRRATRVSETLVPRQYQFLSTLSLRRATVSQGNNFQQSRFLSTLSLRRATGRQPALSQSSEISIHALLAESDLYILI